MELLEHALLLFARNADPCVGDLDAGKPRVDVAVEPDGAGLGELAGDLHEIAEHPAEQMAVLRAFGRCVIMCSRCEETGVE